MKKTLIAIVALAGVAMGAGDSLTLSTAPLYNGTEGGSYAGIAFTLGADDSSRFTMTEGELTELVTLTSISLTERGGNYNFPDDRVLYITNTDKLYLGSSAIYTKAEGSDVAVFDFANSITLNTNTTYYAYIIDSNSVASWEAGVTKVAAGQFYSAPLAAVGGSLTGSTAANWGFLNKDGLASTGFAPMMSITVSNINVPEPTTATLSLLALAGLAARRRRR